MIKSRFTFAAKETNDGKIRQLDDLHVEYLKYLQICLSQMILDKKSNVVPSAVRTYFTPSETLSSQIAKNIQFQAVEMIHTWTRGLYGRKLAKLISKMDDLTDQALMELRCCGKYGVTKAGRFGKGLISQEMVDLYWGWVWNPEVSGNPPTVSDRIPMVMTEMTCVFGPSKKASEFDWWLRFSGLQSGKRIQIPLVSTPYLKDKLAKTITVSKDYKGRWRFQFSENLPDLELDGTAGKIGLDVGLNCLAATSDGRLYGTNFKTTFDLTYNKVKQLRVNRQRQGFKENSPRLTNLETKLTGTIKSAVGTVANKLIKSFPNHTFVVEDLDLSGCKGQKRFAYRALQTTLATKAICEKENPAYTSQECPSCHFVSRNNRKGIKFACKNCGKKKHADVVGGFNLLGRSGDKQIKTYTNPWVVKGILKSRFDKVSDDRIRFSASSCRFGSALLNPKSIAPVPSGRKLTVGGVDVRSSPA